MMDLDAPYQALMDYAMRALSRRAHTSHEFKKKLNKRNPLDPSLNERVLNRLFELKLLDDEAYVQRAIEQATLQLNGYRKVAQKLHLKGIPLKKSSEVWKAMEVDEAALARTLLEKHEKRWIDLPKPKRLQKRAQFLASRGFPPSLVFQLAKRDETS